MMDAYGCDAPEVTSHQHCKFVRVIHLGSLAYRILKYITEELKRLDVAFRQRRKVPYVAHEIVASDDFTILA